MGTEIWTEKYRPLKLSEIINQKHVVERMKGLIRDKSIPHLLFAGPAGTGKTTVALATAREIYGKDWKQNVLELNASDERGIDVIRNKVKEFARTRSIGGVQFRVVILDEADALTQEAQQALRRTMETYANISRFILICNWSSKIIEPIQSRCAVFRFKSLSEEDMEKFVEKISEGEKLKVTPDAVKALIRLSEGDLRKIANLLQTSASLSNKITEEVVYDIASKANPDDVKKMLETALKGNFEDARKKLQELLLQHGLSGSDVIFEIHKSIHSLDGLSEETKIRLIEKCGEYDFRISEGGNELIQLEALVAQFTLFSKKR